MRRFRALILKWFKIEPRTFRVPQPTESLSRKKLKVCRQAGFVCALFSIFSKMTRMRRQFPQTDRPSDVYGRFLSGKFFEIGAQEFSVEKGRKSLK